jgi:hypothetical protein
VTITNDVRRRLPAIALVAALLAIVLPTLVFRYLPMTDLPQHTAIVSIIAHIDDPSFGFAKWYELAFDRTLYFLPYLLALAVLPILSVQAAKQVVVAVAGLAFPVGAGLFLRAAKKPWYLALLALPVVYNRAW